MGRRLLWILAGILVVAFAVYSYIYRPHRDIAKETPGYTLFSSDLIREFREDPGMATEKYTDRVVRVDGRVTDLKKGYVIVDRYIIAQFGDMPVREEGDSISFKGRCLGYDELLEEVRFDECHILN